MPHSIECERRNEYSLTCIFALLTEKETKHRKREHCNHLDSIFGYIFDMMNHVIHLWSHHVLLSSFHSRGLVNLLECKKNNRTNELKFRWACSNNSSWIPSNIHSIWPFTLFVIRSACCTFICSHFVYILLLNRILLRSISLCDWWNFGSWYLLYHCRRKC